MLLRVKGLLLRVKGLLLMVKGLPLSVNGLLLRVKRLLLRVKGVLMTVTTTGARGGARYMLAVWLWLVGQAASFLLIDTGASNGACGMICCMHTG